MPVNYRNPDGSGTSHLELADNHVAQHRDATRHLYRGHAAVGELLGFGAARELDARLEECTEHSSEACWHYLRAIAERDEVIDAGQNARAIMATELAEARRALRWTIHLFDKVLTADVGTSGRPWPAPDEVATLDEVRRIAGPGLMLGEPFAELDTGEPF